LLTLQGFDVPKKPLAIIDFFGVKDFDDRFWTGSVDQLRNNRSDFDPAFDHIFEQKKVVKPDPADQRQEFINQLIQESALLKAVIPFGKLKQADPAMNLDNSFPPTVSVHGTEDWLLPLGLSKRFQAKLQAAGVEGEMIEVEGQNHAFLGKIAKGSKAWHEQRKGFDFLERVLARSYR